MKKDRKIFVVVGIVAVVLVSFLIWRSNGHDADPKVFFACAQDKGINASFKPQAVTLDLSSGRKITLAQTISASGARYANVDQSFVFWNKGNTAFIEENGRQTYTDCVVTPQS
ncbi:MAG TPA: MliC family protein [Candidatus Paceibacterota bacterium]